ncbi:hypothetical protein Q4561_13940 [Alteromonas sp. 1_MG-2023]|uniref:hypothetical protein n=1 Tax=Alteromonas sp. 1_MG-2023 TaxID=3062669 RepID=UPI0026E45462|nr:hypothetical protein [Alteromonas sp. 1_MG-2023]MDO6568169.1 hypothetical protein [Alteromonas sp. 1_MG-2023]
MHSTFLALLLLLLYSGASLAIDDNTITKLYDSSENIDNTINRESVVESLYQQIRPRANITNKSLSQKQVDSKVRLYISDKYLPALVMNYQQIYFQLRASEGQFTSCDNATPINYDDDILKMLCLNENDSHMEVVYMTNGYSQGWKTSATYGFTIDNDEYELTFINLYLKEGVSAYVEGI